LLAQHPLGYSSTPAEIRRRPPTVGEHTDEILSSLGLAPEEIRELRRAGAI
jgi:crotonobetainyl-CoA:carnitine CoA-transferase CaiB-like acyl-CoA transferase